MCGIAGIFMRDGQTIPGQDVIRDMTDVLSHRGPDDSGFYVDGPVALGHRRLSIIDLGTGQQPMFNEDRSLAIVFNGEVYNFEELRMDLESRGHRFRTRSDTETILHAYEEWGEESPSRFRGMFAYAVWDGPRKQLFLARDRIGKKPLYYLETPRYFLFASELKSILRYPPIYKKIDLQAFSDYLSFQYVPGPKCIFQGMRKLQPAHSMTVSRERSSIREYWDIHFRETDGRDERNWAEALGQEIRDAVRCRLKSEVPLGAFLSGGLDSSMVVAGMAGLMDRPVDTLSIGFAEETFNELPYAREVAARFGASHHEYVVDSIDSSIVEKLAWVYDEPFADSSSVPTWHVSRLARQNVTVVLSGDGGDENFAGYRRYYYDLLENRVRRAVPGPVRRALFGLLAAVYPKGDWMPQVLRAKTLFTNLSLSPERGYFRTRSTFQPEMKRSLIHPDVRKVLAGYDSFSVLERYFVKANSDDPLSRVQYVDMKTYLPDNILVKVDRASMANSLEVRAPLLDHRLMEFAAAMPSGIKLKGRTGKHVFKLAAEGVLPESLIHRRKMGFSIPLDHWFRTTFKPVAGDLLLAPNARLYRYLDPSLVRRMWEHHQKGWKNYGTHLWSLLSFESWYRKHLG